MTIDEFLEKIVEGYLFHDLESMVKISLPPDQNDGAAGYPMIATTLAGMELLGQLLMPNTKPFNPKDGSKYFLNFWDNYFSRRYTTYVGLGSLFRHLLRHGIAHTFVAKSGVFVEKGSNRQTSIDTSRQEIYVDCVVFFREFEDVYKKLVKPITQAPNTTALTTKANMQAQLDSLADVYLKDNQRLFSSLSTLHFSTPNVTRRSFAPLSPLVSSNVMASGASGSIPPATATISGSMIDPSATAIFPSTTLPFDRSNNKSLSDDNS